jgi:hypothetical protein
VNNKDEMNRDEDFDNNREIRVFDAANKASVFIVDYGGYMRKENGRHQLLMAIKVYPFLFLKNSPSDNLNMPSNLGLANYFKRSLCDWQ